MWNPKCLQFVLSNLIILNNDTFVVRLHVLAGQNSEESSFRVGLDIVEKCLLSTLSVSGVQLEHSKLNKHQLYSFSVAKWETVQNKQYFMLKGIIFPLPHCLLRFRYAADGFHAEEHSSCNRWGVHWLQVVCFTEEHRSGCHPGQSRSRVGSHGIIIFH